MDYFVTGGTGFIGGRLVRRLVSAGHTVHALARFPGRARDLEIPGVVVHRGDVEHRESMRRAMEGVDGLFHLAGWYRIGDRDASRGSTRNELPSVPCGQIMIKFAPESKTTLTVQKSMQG